MTTKQAIWRSAVMLAMVGVTLGLCVKFPNAAENSESGMVLNLPLEVPGHVAYKREPSEEELEWLPKDTGLLKMLYVPEDAQVRDWGEAAEAGISASLILSGNDRRSLHRPQVCLRAQGWHIAKREIVKLRVGEEDLEIMDFWLRRKVAEEDGKIRHIRAHYYYWWIGANTSTPSDFKRILITVLDNMFKNVNNRWGYPSVLVYVDLEDKKTVEQVAGAEEEARKRALGFIRAYAPLFQKSLGAVQTE